MDEKETGRLEAFSDGVFAVAITLLVLNVKVPGLDPPQVLDDEHLWPALTSEWPMLVAYITSFATIGIMWLNHHRLFIHIKRTDTGLLLINLLLLLIIVFIPVPTALLAEHIAYPDHKAAAFVYTGTYFLMACCFNLLWRYASFHSRLLGKTVSPHAIAAINGQYALGPLFYLITFAAVWISPLVSVLMSFILALFFALPSRSLSLRSEKGGDAEEKEEMDL